MTPSDELALGEVLRNRLSSLAAPGRWSMAAVAVAGGRRGWWLSDATRASAFHLGSVTKTMTAVALAVGVADSRVALDDDLGQFLPAAAGGAVQLVDLATHTAGYPRLPRELVLRSLRRPRDPYSCISDRSVDRALGRLSRSRARAKRTYAYSNFGYGVLGRALAIAADAAFFDVLRADVLEPLGLDATTLDRRDGPDRVAGHDATGRAVPPWHNEALAGCGCLWSNIDDVARYLVANLEPSTTPRREALDLVQAPRIVVAPGLEIGLGWHVSSTESGARHWHNGGTSGFGAFVGFNRGTGVGVAVLMSRAHGDDLDRAAGAALTDVEALADSSGRLAT